MSMNSYYLEQAFELASLSASFVTDWWTWLTGGVMALLLLTYIAHRTSGTARYYFKFTAFTLLSLAAAVWPIPLMLIRPKDSRNALIPAQGSRFASWLLGVRWTVRGKENIVKDSGCVVLINHQSAFDLTVLAILWPLMERCTQIAKKEVFYLWPFGLAAWLWGTIFIDRVNAEKAQQTINKTGKTIRDKKARVLMFPEGTRGDGENLLPFKKGAFHVAIASQCPIQPVVVSRYHFIDSKKKRFDEGSSIITILPAISTEGLTKVDLPMLIEKTRNIMIEVYNRTSEESLQDYQNSNQCKIKET